MRSSIGLVKMYSERTKSAVERGALVMYPMNSVLLKSFLEFRQKATYNRNTHVGFLPAEYVEDAGGVNEAEEVERSVR